MIYTIPLKMKKKLQNLILIEYDLYTSSEDEEEIANPYLVANEEDNDKMLERDIRYNNCGSFKYITSDVSKATTTTKKFDKKKG
ncbi:uncharacterized protein DS421_18g618000 [Arachis hypogaea]|nr:uncharacterized protein DS421_18g618000 [Arachis hypogaea]